MCNIFPLLKLMFGHLHLDLHEIVRIKAFKIIIIKFPLSKAEETICVNATAKWLLELFCSLLPFRWDVTVMYSAA